MNRLSRRRRWFVLALAGGAVSVACGDAAPWSLFGASPSPSPSPLAGPPVAVSPGPSPGPGQPVATSVVIGASPSPPSTPFVQPGLPLIVPGRAPSPSPGAAASPAPSPAPLPIVLARAGWIAVSQGGRVLLVDPARQQPARTIVSTADNAAPLWAPDGRSVALVGGRGPAAEIHLVTVDGGASRRLTANTRPERGVAWSPASDRLAYVLPRSLGADGRDDPAEPEEVWMVDLASGADRKLADGFDPCWSPDGHWIAYATNGQRDANGPRANAIRVVGADGQNDRPLLAVSDLPDDLLASFGLPFRPGTLRLRGPAWSPDGTRLVASADGHTSMAVTFDVTGRTLRPWALAYEGGVGRARWSPDGARLAIESRPATGVEIVSVVEIATGRETLIGGPASGYQASAPSWSPDATRVALITSGLPSRRNEPRKTALAVFGTDGTDRGTLLEADDLRDPDWGRAP